MHQVRPYLNVMRPLFSTLNISFKFFFFFLLNLNFSENTPQLSQASNKYMFKNLTLLINYEMQRTKRAVREYLHLKSMVDFVIHFTCRVSNVYTNNLNVN